MLPAFYFCFLFFLCFLLRFPVPDTAKEPVFPGYQHASAPQTKARGICKEQKNGFHFVHGTASFSQDESRLF
jgi:hypothetical protein